MSVVGKYFIRGSEPGEGDRVRLSLVKRDPDGYQRTLMIEIPANLDQMSITRAAVRGEPIPTDVEVISEGCVSVQAVEKWQAERLAEECAADENPNSVKGEGK